MTNEAEKTYLGDGISVHWISSAWGDVLVLTTEDGKRVTNIIELDQERWRALQDFVGDREQTEGNEYHAY